MREPRRLSRPIYGILFSDLDSFAIFDPELIPSPYCQTPPVFNQNRFTIHFLVSLCLWYPLIVARENDYCNDCNV